MQFRAPHKSLVRSSIRATSQGACRGKLDFKFLCFFLRLTIELLCTIIATICNNKSMELIWFKILKIEANLKQFWCFFFRWKLAIDLYIYPSIEYNLKYSRNPVYRNFILFYSWFCHEICFTWNDCRTKPWEINSIWPLLKFRELQNWVSWPGLILCWRVDPSPGHIWPHSRLQHLTIIIVHGRVHILHAIQTKIFLDTE